MLVINIFNNKIYLGVVMCDVNTIVVGNKYQVSFQGMNKTIIHNIEVLGVTPKSIVFNTSAFPKSMLRTNLSFFKKHYSIDKELPMTAFVN